MAAPNWHNDRQQHRPASAVSASVGSGLLPSTIAPGFGLLISVLSLTASCSDCTPGICQNTAVTAPSLRYLRQGRRCYAHRNNEPTPTTDPRYGCQQRARWWSRWPCLPLPGGDFSSAIALLKDALALP